MLAHSLAKALSIAFFCGAAAFTATWVRQRQLSAPERSGRPAGMTPLWAGVTAFIGALLGIAVAQGLPA